MALRSGRGAQWRSWGAVALTAAAAVASSASVAVAAPSNPPTLTAVFNDARTDDNEFIGVDGKHRWSIDLPADRYQNEFYERPTVQGFNTDGGAGTYSAEQYFANLDIVSARAGRDLQFFYVEINLVGDYFKKSDGTIDAQGTKYEYGFRFSTDPDGRNGYFMYGTLNDPHAQANWTALKTKVSRDTDMDVGGRGGPLHGNPGPTGLNVTKSDNSKEDDHSLNGYDQDVVDDGKIKISGHPAFETEVLFMRLVGTSTIQFAFDYATFGQGLNAAYFDALQYLDMQAIAGDPQDPRKYFWNDKFTFDEAGSPYLADFNNGIQRPNNIYELDTIRGGAIPEPAALAWAALLALAMRRRRA